MDGEEDVLEEEREFKTDEEGELDSPPEGVEEDFGLEDPDDRYH